MSDLILPDEYTLPQDLKNLGLKCTDCGSNNSIYEITDPAPGFPMGTYCYKCLLNHCRLGQGFPMPIETDLLNRLQTDLGLTPAKTFYFMGIP